MYLNLIRKFIVAKVNPIKFIWYRFLLFYHKRIKKDNNNGITIIIPVHNHYDYLAECINSALNQDTKYPFEICIVDDCSPDPRVKPLLEELALKNPEKINLIFNKKNLGISTTQNIAINNAKYNWILFLDCDDFLGKDAINISIDYILKNPNAVYFYSDRIILDESEEEVFCIYKALPFLKEGQDIQGLMHNMITNHLKIINKYAMLSCGMFVDEFQKAQDYELAFKLALFYKFKHIHKLLYYYRRHKDSVSSREEVNNYIIAAKLYRRYLKLFPKKPINNEELHSLNFDFYQLADKFIGDKMDRPLISVDLRNRIDLLYIAQRLAYLDLIYIYDHTLLDDLLKTFTVICRNNKEYNFQYKYIKYQLMPNN